MSILYDFASFSMHQVASLRRTSCFVLLCRASGLYWSERLSFTIMKRLIIVSVSRCRSVSVFVRHRPMCVTADLWSDLTSSLGL